jgi:hypothetical protein
MFGVRGLDGFAFVDALTMPEDMEDALRASFMAADREAHLVK